MILKHNRLLYPQPPPVGSSAHRARWRYHRRLRPSAGQAGGLPAAIGSAVTASVVVNVCDSSGVRGAWGWLGIEWVELDCTPPAFFIVADARIDRAMVHSGAPEVVLCFNGLVLDDVELPLPIVGCCVVVTVLDDAVVFDCVASAPTVEVDATPENARHGASASIVYHFSLPSIIIPSDFVII